MHEPLSVFSHHSRKQWIGWNHFLWWVNRVDGIVWIEKETLSVNQPVFPLKETTSRNIGSAIDFVPILIVFSNISVHKPFNLNSISNVLADVVHLKGKIGFGMHQGVSRKFNTDITNEFALQTFQRWFLNLMNSQTAPQRLCSVIGLKIRDKSIFPERHMTCLMEISLAINCLHVFKKR